MKGIVLTIACVVSATGAYAAPAAGNPAIRQSSIAGARLGLNASSYQTLLGGNGVQSTVSQPDGWSKLEFDAKKLSVYFAAGASGRGTIVTTWNKNYRTAKGVGPCSSVKRLKHAYGRSLKPSKFNSQGGVVDAWTVGKNLVFATNGGNRVQAVGLYNGGAPDATKHGGTLAYAGFVTVSETSCS